MISASLFYIIKRKNICKKELQVSEINWLFATASWKISIQKFQYANCYFFSHR